MTIARTATTRRRPPPPQGRYRAVARAAKGRRVRRRLPPLLAGLAWGIVLASAALVADTAALGVTRATGAFGGLVNAFIPVPIAIGDLTVSDTAGQIGAAPVLDPLPQFTKDSAFVVQGVIPSFVRAADRKVAVALNNGSAIVVPFDSNGHFAVPLTLAEGTNQILVSLETPTGALASTTATVVLDRTAPPLSVSKPKNGDTLDRTTFTIEGKSEPGASVLVNDKSVIVGQDGSFIETLTAAVGPFPITVIARDRAGNETKSQLAVTVKAPTTPAAGTTVTVSLANATVKPGGFVIANVAVLNGGQPVAGLIVSLQVGVVPIGTATTDAGGHATITFFAPPNEGIAQVVVLAGSASGSAVLTVAK